MNLVGLDHAKNQTDIFHKAFGHQYSEKPTMLTKEQVVTRVNFIAEELVELLGAVATDEDDLSSMIDGVVGALNEAEIKQIKSGFNETEEQKMVAIVDGLTDINVFVQGTFSMLGIQPQAPYDIVMNANMAKLGPDGKPIYRESDGKIMKPVGWEENWAPEPKLLKEVRRQKGEN